MYDAAASASGALVAITRRPMTRSAAAARAPQLALPLP